MTASTPQSQHIDNFPWKDHMYNHLGLRDSSNLIQADCLLSRKLFEFSLCEQVSRHLDHPRVLMARNFLKVEYTVFGETEFPYLYPRDIILTGFCIMLAFLQVRCVCRRFCARLSHFTALIFC